MVPLRQHVRRHRYDDHVARRPRPGPHCLAALIAILLATLTYGSAKVSAERSAAALAISASGTVLRIDDRPAFLFGVSFFGALDDSPGDADLDAVSQWGSRVVRTWAHWREPIYQRDGALTPIGRTRLLRLAERLRSRGLILELVLLRPGQLPGQRYAVFSSEQARVRAVTDIATALKDYRNILFDLYNEHDHPDGPISHRGARALRDAVKAADSSRLVTISSTGGHLVNGDSHIGADESRNLREEASLDAGAVGVDVVAPHFPRTGDWAASTGIRVKAIRAALDGIGRPLPIYLNEENRAEPDAALPPDAYERAFIAARDAGAAGWIFHTAAGFSLHERPFASALTADERAGLERLARIAK